MAGLLLRTGISAFGLWLAAKMLSGLEFDGTGTLLAAAFLLGLVNAFARPLVILLTLPFTVVTFGLFLLVINAGMLKLVELLLPGFHLAGFWPAFFGAIVVSLVAWVASWYVGPRGRLDVMVVRQP